MKLASYRDGSRDGQLVVVSRDLSTAHFAAGIATRLQQVLDDWNYLSPQLEDLYQTLNGGKARHAFPFDPARCAAPLPRTACWAEAAAYPSDGAGVRPARKAAVDAEAPRWRHDAGDGLLGALDDVRLRSDRHGVDFGAGLAVVTGDVARGSGAAQALEGVRLLMLANSWRFDALEGDRPAPAFGPVAATPDELGDAWQQGRVHAALEVALGTGSRQRDLAAIDVAATQRWDFGTLLAALAAHRALGAGSVVGGGALASVAALRAGGDGNGADTPWLRDADRVRVTLRGADGAQPLGTIDQTVSVAEPD